MRTLRIWSALWALSLGLLALPTLPTVVALGSAGIFGAAYMALTGLLILWGVADMADDATAGVRACFLALGAGQAIATPMAGVVADVWSLPAAFALAATGSLAQLVIAPAAERAGTSPPPLLHAEAS
ncbi:hypothetical protein [Egicoccus sp. AB-alg2]|uniref:hypothetical protein n=1 Tax=Egicoccus sp. AB-alg2 TaxID=3242693 RepID=UPI00359D68BC